MTSFTPASPRKPWPQYFMDITRLVAERSTCLRRRVGAIAVKERRILATGYNGAPRRMRDCLELGCIRERLEVPSGQRHELCRGLHAEQNVLVQAAVHGVSIQGADIYCTHQPCLICTKLLINCGVAAVYYLSPYPDTMAEEMFAEAGITLTRIEDGQASFRKSGSASGQNSDGESGQEPEARAKRL